MTTAAVCDNATGVLKYEAFCGSNVNVKGTLKPNTTDMLPAPWVAEMCTDSKDQLATCGDNAVLALGGFQLTNKGTVDPKRCLTDFPNQSPTGLPAGQVLRYTEQFAPNTNCTGPRISASDAKRRMCHDNTFFNPDFETTGITTNPPCDPQQGGNVTFRAGIEATDTADIVAAMLEENQWRPNSTLNLSCNNQGTVPTTIRNSENFAASSFQFGDGDIVAYVKGFPGLGNEAFATSATDILTNGVPTGKRVTFNDCTTDPNKPGLDEVICKAVVANVIPPNAKTVDLTIRGEQADEQGLGFIGDALAVPINNLGNCPQILNP